MEVGVRLSGPLFVLLASGLITSVVVLHFRIIIPYFGKPLSSFVGILNVLISVFIAGNLFFNYYMIVFTPPGYSSESNSVPQVTTHVLHQYFQFRSEFPFSQRKKLNPTMLRKKEKDLADTVKRVGDQNPRDPIIVMSVKG